VDDVEQLARDSGWLHLDWNGPAAEKRVDLRRYGFSAEQKTDIWRRWKSAESLHEIGRAFHNDHGSIQYLLAQHGGIVPAIRRRSQRTLTLAEREGISRGIAAGLSIREIARRLQRPASTVSREVARHGGRMVYRASEADERAWKAALTRQIRKLPASLRRTLTWDRGWRWPNTRPLPSPRRSTSTSVIHKVLGNAAQTRTPTDF